VSDVEPESNGSEGMPVDELQELIRSSFEHPNVDDDGTFRLLVRTAPEIMALPEPPESHRLLGPLVFRGNRTIVVGDTGHGKTSFALQMLAAILRGDPMLQWKGAGVGPVLVVDLEQGIRSIKRGIREAGLEDDERLLYVTVPDGLALDQDRDHLIALSETLAVHKPVVVLLDPFYKAHRAEEPNAERPIIDLMRLLDSLRTAFGFALIMPAHPRKDVGGAKDGARKLTIHDVAGSGAVTRGAEIVIAVERMGHGYARLRYLKDRDGELPVNDSIGMLFNKDDGFHLDPRSVETDEGVETLIMETTLGWATTTEWGKHLRVRRDRIAAILEGMAARGHVAYAVGPAGKRADAKCYSTRQEHVSRLFDVGEDADQGEPAQPVPEGRDKLGQHRPAPSGEDPVPFPPPVRGGKGRDRLADDDFAPDKQSDAERPNPLLEGLS
jgi:hypothetical protein